MSLLMDKLDKYISEANHHTSVYSGTMDFDEVLIEYTELDKKGRIKFLSHLNKGMKDKIIKMEQGGLI